MATNQDYPVPDYGWKDEFVAKPTPDAIERDLTQATLVFDMQNTLGETFHWEADPRFYVGSPNGQKTGNPAFGDKTFVTLNFPVLLPK